MPNNSKKSGKAPLGGAPLKSKVRIAYLPKYDSPDVMKMWSSPEKYYASKELHDSSWAAIMARYAKASASLQKKLESGNAELDLTSEERAVLEGAKRRSNTGGGSSGGPKRPAEVLKAMLGFVIPMLGKYATSIAMEWLNSEIKYVTTTVSGVITTTSGYNLLNGVAQGTDYNQRVGNSIRILGLDWLLQVYNQHADANQQYRYVILVDTQTDGAAPSDAEIVEGGGAFVISSLLPNIKASPERFAILHDKIFNMDATVNAIHYDRVKLDNLVGQDLHTLYELTTAVVAAISKGSIYFAHVSTDGVNGVTVSANFRVFYTDN